MQWRNGTLSRQAPRAGLRVAQAVSRCSHQGSRAERPAVPAVLSAGPRSVRVNIRGPDTTVRFVAPGENPVGKAAPIVDPSAYLPAATPRGTRSFQTSDRLLRGKTDCERISGDADDLGRFGLRSHRKSHAVARGLDREVVQRARRPGGPGRRRQRNCNRPPGGQRHGVRPRPHE